MSETFSEKRENLDDDLHDLNCSELPQISLREKESSMTIGLIPMTKAPPYHFNRYRFYLYIFILLVVIL